MPELPDIELYLHALRPRILESASRAHPPRQPVSGALVRPADRTGARQNCHRAAPSRQAPGVGARGRSVPRHPLDDRRPLQVRSSAARRFPARSASRRSIFPSGTLILTEAGSKRRASLYLVRGRSGARRARSRRSRGADVDGRAVWRGADARESHAQARADRSRILLSGIGNAYSDEILHAAKLSPMQLTSKLTPRADRDACTRTRSAC